MGRTWSLVGIAAATSTITTTAAAAYVVAFSSFGTTTVSFSDLTTFLPAAAYVTLAASLWGKAITIYKVCDIDFWESQFAPYVIMNSQACGND